MAWFRKCNTGDAAWYRHRNYKGNLGEDQKMELDSIRWQSKSGRHPAAKLEDLPKEVQEYISNLEYEIAEEKSSMSMLFIVAGILSMIYCALSKLYEPIFSYSLCSA
jgi:hypothetical protein